MPRFETMLVPLDFSRHSDHALDLAIEMASTLGTQRIVLLHVHQPLPIPTQIAGSDTGAVALEDRILREARLAVEVRAERVKAAALEVYVEVSTGSPAEVICREATARGADLIVMGTSGRTGLAHVVLGSVADRTVARAPCPVLTARAPEDETR